VVGKKPQTFSILSEISRMFSFALVEYSLVATLDYCDDEYSPPYIRRRIVEEPT
jgi:hypothetical protein